MTTLENIVKLIIKCFPSGADVDNLRVENLHLETKIEKLKARLQLAENEALRYQKLYSDATNKRSYSYDKMREEQANRAQQEQDRYRQFTSGNPQFNFDDMKRAEEAMRGQQRTQHRQQPTWEDIKAKYKADMKANHPDSIQARGGSAANIASATINAQRINEQYKKDKKRYGK